MATNRTITACIVMAMVIAVGNALQCHQCGQYNDGVGSITPCLNYTDQSAHLYLKDCPRSSDKFCIVSIKSINQLNHLFLSIYHFILCQFFT